MIEVEGVLGVGHLVGGGKGGGRGVTPAQTVLRSTELLDYILYP